MTTTAITVRDAGEEDLDAILDIYNQEVLNGVATFDLEPRTMEEQRRWLSEHAAPYCALVAVDEAGAVLGYASLSRYQRKRGYDLAAEDTVYIRPEYHRRGIGRQLLSALLRRARAAGFHTVLGRIESSNVASIELHRALGFEIVGTEREVGLKFGRWLDVVTVQTLLTDKIA